MAGRPIGSIKDLNRPRAKYVKSSGKTQLIDKGGKRYNDLLKTGYKVTTQSDGKELLVLDGNFIPQQVVKRRRGRPRVVPLSDNKKVKNPESGRLIKTNTQYFRKLVKKYGYDEVRNAFLMYVLDPKDPNTKIVKNDETFNKYLKHGYIYNENDNSFIIPSQKSESAFINGMKVYELKIINKDDPLIQMNQLNIRTNVLLKRALDKLKGIKFNIGLDIQFIKTVDGVEVKESFPMSEKVTTVTHRSEIKKSLELQRDGLLRRIDRFTNGGSGWRIHRIMRHYVNINKYKPLRARGFIALPNEINNRKATINIQNKDDKCFIYCLGRAFDPNPEKAHLERVSKHLKQVCTELGFDRIKTPVTVKDIPKIEKQFDISINLFGHHNVSEIYPILITKKVVDDTKHIDLLITSKEDENHYV